jgi:hypothetical protein
MSNLSGQPGGGSRAFGGRYRPESLALKAVIRHFKAFRRLLKGVLQAFWKVFKMHPKDL